MFWSPWFLLKFRAQTQERVCLTPFSTAVETGFRSSFWRWKITSVKLWRSSEVVLLSAGVDMLINGSVSVGKPHLLECCSGYLATIFYAALAIIFALWTTYSVFVTRYVQTWLARILVSHGKKNWREGTSEHAQILPLDTHKCLQHNSVGIWSKGHSRRCLLLLSITTSFAWDHAVSTTLRHLPELQYFG